MCEEIRYWKYDETRECKTDQAGLGVGGSKYINAAILSHLKSTFIEKYTWNPTWEYIKPYYLRKKTKVN